MVGSLCNCSIFLARSDGSKFHKCNLRPALTLGVKAEIEKKNLISPKLLINVELYSLVLTPRLKKGYHRIWGSQFATLGATVPAFISKLGGANKKPKMLKVGPKCFGPLSPM
jgi:hypothetical protein